MYKKTRERRKHKQQRPSQKPIFFSVVVAGQGQREGGGMVVNKLRADGATELQCGGRLNQKQAEERGRQVLGNWCEVTSMRHVVIASSQSTVWSV